MKRLNKEVVIRLLPYLEKCKEYYLNEEQLIGFCRWAKLYLPVELKLLFFYELKQDIDTEKYNEDSLYWYETGIVGRKLRILNLQRTIDRLYPITIDDNQKKTSKLLNVNFKGYCKWDFLSRRDRMIKTLISIFSKE